MYAFIVIWFHWKHEFYQMDVQISILSDFRDWILINEIIAQIYTN